MMEEAQPTNSYINMRGEAIDVIEKTISELGSVFGQLAAMVSEQGFVVPFDFRGQSLICPLARWFRGSTPTRKM